MPQESALPNAFSPRQEEGVPSPARLFVTTLVCVFVAELLSFLLLGDAHGPRSVVASLIDTLVLLSVACPLVYLLLYRPLTLQILRRRLAEQAVGKARDELEARVAERTAELEDANQRLLAKAEERRLAVEQIRTQSRLLDAVEQAVAAVDESGRIRYWNRYAEVLYGWSASEVGDRTFADLWPAEAEHRVFAADSGGPAWVGEVELVRRNGEMFPAWVSRATIRGLDGRPEGSVVTSVDISDRKAAEEALRYSEEKYSTLVENSPTGIFIVRDGCVAFVNSPLARLLESSREELVGIDPLSLVCPDDRANLSEIGRKRLAGEPVPDEYECRLVTKTGRQRWVAMRNTLVPYRDGVVTLGNVLDVTERRQMEEALRGLSARLLTIQEEERGRLAREIHDSLGQTLSAVKYLLEAALGGEWHEPCQDRRNSLLLVVPKIQDAIGEVRHISMALRPSLLDDLGLLPTITWYLREFQETYANLRVEHTLDAAESEIPRDLRTPLFRILQEATNNVAKHSGAALLRVELEGRDATLRLRVRDDGVGFSPGQPRGENTGTGQSSMRDRAQLSGGSLTVASEPGAGTTVEAVWRLSHQPAAGA